jgi:hypothetical protein
MCVLTTCFRSELLEILLDINQSAAIPTDLRFDVRTPAQRERAMYVEPDITPERSSVMLGEYTAAITKGIIPPLDLHIVRDHIDETLAAQGVIPLEELEHNVPHPYAAGEEDLPEEDRGDEPPSFLSTAQEAEYLQRLDAKLGDRLSLDKDLEHPQVPHQAELTPRELERHMELLNPQSQHNWLKLHSKMHASLDNDDTESLASHEGGSSSKPAGRKRGKNLAKQVGDRAMERAYDGMSPSAASGFDEEELQTIEEPGSGRKRARDPDGAYRVKGGRGGAVKGGKRKRLTEDATGASKKARMSETFGAEA